jgi:hypothetical protein
MNLQERFTVLMFTENNRDLCSRDLCTLGVVNRDEEVLEWAGFPQEEEQLHLVEVEPEVVGQHPS